MGIILAGKSIMTPRELFEFLAATTWKSIERAQRLHILWGEDATTSVNLCAIASAGFPGVIVEDTRVDEAHKGCDFELWVGSDKTGWNRFAMQAKKTDGRGRYVKLKHAVKGSATLQIDVLDAYAAKNRALALYCFYNYSTAAYKWNCQTFPDDTEQLGCSVAPSSVVRSAMGKRGGSSFKYLHSTSSTLPWRCLVACPFLNTAPPSGQAVAGSSFDGWPSRETYFHQMLPQSLRELRSNREASTVRLPDYSKDSDAPARDELHPAWVGIVEISPQEETPQ